jgi:hypothetical protein
VRWKQIEALNTMPVMALTPLPFAQTCLLPFRVAYRHRGRFLPSILKKIDAAQERGLPEPLAPMIEPPPLFTAEIGFFRVIGAEALGHAAWKKGHAVLRARAGQRICSIA